MRRKEIRQLSLARWALRVAALASLILFLHVYTTVARGDEPVHQCGVRVLAVEPGGPTLHGSVCVLDTRKLMLCLLDDATKIPGVARCFVVVETTEQGFEIVEPAEVLVIPPPKET